MRKTIQEMKHDVFCQKERVAMLSNAYQKLVHEQFLMSDHLFSMTCNIKTFNDLSKAIYNLELLLQKHKDLLFHFERDLSYESKPVEEPFITGARPIQDVYFKTMDKAMASSDLLG